MRKVKSAAEQQAKERAAYALYAEATARIAAISRRAFAAGDHRKATELSPEERVAWRGAIKEQQRMLRNWLRAQDQLVELARQERQP